MGRKSGFYSLFIFQAVTNYGLPPFPFESVGPVPSQVQSPEGQLGQVPSPGPVPVPLPGSAVGGGVGAGSGAPF